MTFKVSVLLMV